MPKQMCCATSVSHDCGLHGGLFMTLVMVDDWRWSAVLIDSISVVRTRFLYANWSCKLFYISCIMSQIVYCLQSRFRLEWSKTSWNCFNIMYNDWLFKFQWCTWLDRWKCIMAVVYCRLLNHALHIASNWKFPLVCPNVTAIFKHWSVMQVLEMVQCCM